MDVTSFGYSRQSSHSGLAASHIGRTNGSGEYFTLAAYTSIAVRADDAVRLDLIVIDDNRLSTSVQQILSRLSIGPTCLSPQKCW